MYMSLFRPCMSYIFKNKQPLLYNLDLCKFPGINPITWSDAITTVKTGKFNNFCRINQSEYIEHMNQVRQQYPSVSYYILSKKFGLIRSFPGDTQSLNNFFSPL